MGRRKKEPEAVHRQNIAGAARRLFAQKGLEAATMDDIAREAGYSKATLYVYFRNKEEIVGALVLESMKQLHELLCAAILENPGTKAGYNAICRALTDYQEAFPLYFEAALGKIRIDPVAPDAVERETFETGERINGELSRFLRAGIAAGELRPDLPVLETVFLFWASLSGVIRMAANKQDYLEKTLGVTKRQFLESGFETLYRAIAAEEKMG